MGRLSCIMCSFDRISTSWPHSLFGDGMVCPLCVAIRYDYRETVVAGAEYQSSRQSLTLTEEVTLCVDREAVDTTLDIPKSILFATVVYN